MRRPAVGVPGDRPTSELASALEQHLRLRSGGQSLDVLGQLRDCAWFAPGALDTPLAHILRRVALTFLAPRGRRIGLRADGAEPDLPSRWRWLSLVLPCDLLLAAYAAVGDCEPPNEHVQLVSPQLHQLLREPCAETHLHVGAALSFGLLWTGLMRTLADQPPNPDKLKKSPSSPFGGGAPHLCMLLAAATTRLLLASFLRDHGRASDPRAFRRFLEPHLDRLCDKLPWSFGPAHARRECLRALGLLAGTADPTTWQLARKLYRALCGPPADVKAPHPMAPDPLRTVVSRDPLAAWLPYGEEQALPETRFACHALRYLLGPGQADGDFALLFWQYQRVRCLLYRHLTEEPGTAGLDWFTRHYARISPLRDALDGAIYSHALQVQGKDLSLGALEARTSPTASWTAVRDEVRCLARQAHQASARQTIPEVGLVLHFIKQWHTTGPGVPRLHADPRHPAFGCRHGRWFHERHREALAIAAALRHNPELLLVLRGVDIANVELAQPTWLLAPLLRCVRQAAAAASARLALARPRWAVSPLRVTLHAGEDFRRLSEGLRRLHEPIEFLLLEQGDRVGHGLSLGLDPARWAEGARIIPQPAEERLDDLLWELARYRAAQLHVDAGRLEYARSEALRLGAHIYQPQEPLLLEHLLEARRLRHDPRALERLGFPFPTRQPPGPVGALLWHHLTDTGVFLRGQEVEAVAVNDSEVAMLREAQRWLRKELGRLEITVESNPSSNLLIGDLLALEEHPAFRLQPLPSQAEPEGGPVLLSVNTDNPITFSSCLADEFAHIYHALLRKQVRAQDALLWLDRVRMNGWRSRFTLPTSARAEALAELLPRSHSS